MIRNDIRRIRIKLKIMEETPNIDWVLHDLIDRVDLLINGCNNATNSQRLMIINDLKLEYRKFLEKEVPEDPKQMKLL